ncbi:peptidase of plants and bacteria-domain-containing protein [Podospora aff. communis PSN243]|uniref:Peptidase of plants and bacteria-domain-containing protein n=1 Tax=Podospora aff. communis PSN243 TaxID=3040156 RepID=A0AAV9H350_9PEZI|nr:peptidase of plants and bacteria-domain-containing protein [Podospora aff. communis PSN243]
MTVRPQVTQAPQPSAIFTPPSTDPNSSAVPIPDRTADSTSSSTSKPGKESPFAQPKLRLEIRDLDHPGASKFLSAINVSTVFSAAVKNVQRLLYRTPLEPHTTCPPTRSVTLILRDMGGVAYTTGTELDSDHKEIHFSLSYINGINPPSRLTAEITGVLTHELVHCYQWNACGSCPGGLIEGIADWVRLNCDLSPPHWKREVDGDWDRGYQHTAYFLQYLETRFGEGTVRRVNEKLRLHKYEAKPFWTELLGRPVEQLYGDYCGTEGGKAGESSCC